MLIDSTQLALERAMEGAGLRQQALAANIANANTPGYQRQDVDFHGTLQRAMGAGRAGLESASFAIEQTGEGSVRPDGGTVDVDREATELAQNGLEYQALATVIRGQSDIIRAAMSKK